MKSIFKVCARQTLASSFSGRAFLGTAVGARADKSDVGVEGVDWGHKDHCRIPFTASEGHDLAPVSNILEQFERDLKQKTETHAGYPYNLNYNFEELFKFMNYSINNLGDPFVKSNYGVHSRSFEISVVEFFSRLWKLRKDESGAM